MSRIDEVAKTVNTRELLEKLSIEGIKDIGDEFSCRCPFHDDERNSFSINKETKLWYCHAENVGGNIVQLVMRALEITKEDAYKFLGIEREYENENKIFRKSKTFFDVLKPNSKKKEEKKVYNVTSILELMSKEPPSYFFDRGFDMWLWNFFNLRFAHEGPYSNRVVIPVSDQNGDIIALTGRTVLLDGDKWKHSYKFEKAKHIFNIYNSLKYLEEIRYNNKNGTKKSVYVVEGPFDVFRFYQSQIFNAVAIFGASMSDEQASILINNFSQATLVFDSDEAGYRCLKESVDKLKGQIGLSYVTLPEGYDPGDIDRSMLANYIYSNTKQGYFIDFERI